MVRINLLLTLILSSFCLSFCLSFWTARPCQAQTPHETYFFKGTPASDTVEGWSKLPGSRSYLIQTVDPQSEELEPLTRLKGVDRLQVEVERFPATYNVPIWKRLASQGVELIGFKSGLPTEDELHRLNEIGFAKYTFVLDHYPGGDAGEKLAKLRGDISLTVASNSFPRFTEKPALQQIPATIPMLIIADMWPFYNQMDVLNLLPMPQRLRIMGMMPPLDSLQYLRHLQRLRDITVDINSDPSLSEWQRLEGFDVRWSSRGYVPSAAGLAAFAQSAGPSSPRKLIVDQDGELTQDEFARLARSPIQVEWIHSAGRSAPQ